MELGYVLAWTVGISSGLALLVGALRRGQRPFGWLGVHAALLLILGASIVLWSIETAGHAAFFLWTVFVLIPIFSARRCALRLSTRDFSGARRWARVLAALHPWDGWKHQPRFVEGLEALQAGDGERAKAIADELPRSSPLRRALEARRLRTVGDYPGALAWISRMSAAERRDPTIRSLQLRAEGEVGDSGAMLRSFRRWREAPLDPAERAALFLQFCALVGAVGETDALLAVAFAEMPENDKRYWKATARQAAGQSSQDAFQSLAERADSWLGRQAHYRLSHPLPPVLPSPELIVALEEIRSEVASGALVGARKIRPFATLGACAVLLVAFALQVPGGSTNLENLHELGALVLPFEGAHESWRIFTAALLHYGAVHLALNVLGLFVLGVRVERELGRLAVWLIFWGSAFGALALVAMFHSGDGGLLVGASGGVMGLLGALLLILGHKALSDRGNAARSTFALLVVVLVLQVVFDAVTPQVSGFTHILGAALGALIAVPLVTRERRSRRRRGSV